MTGMAPLRRIALTVADAARAERFYREGLGFERVPAAPLVMRLGHQEIALETFDPPGAPYPTGSTSCDLWFQHFAIVVADMAEAHARVMAQPGCTAISRHGPRRLPPGTGNVTAFKFRDPDGHPLELLAFPRENTPASWRDDGGKTFLGIDHSAISVSDVERSIAFYGERLGLEVAGRSLNRGPEQADLDDLADPVVDVVALAMPGATKPHLELLGYRAPRGRPIAAVASAHDIAMTRLVCEVQGGGGRVVRDPDGHLLVLAQPSLSSR
ncbi:MAG TPA: VOC family protein [Usitatibacter sp.]|nr:VOC family protein [Usitatibacter sp.]